MNEREEERRSKKDRKKARKKIKRAGTKYTQIRKELK